VLKEGEAPGSSGAVKVATNTEVFMPHANAPFSATDRVLLIKRETVDTRLSRTLRRNSASHAMAHRWTPTSGALNAHLTTPANPPLLDPATWAQARRGARCAQH
jgi:hypothetical protein